MAVRVIDLPWLPQPPEDFRMKARSLLEDSGSSREMARRLSEYRLTSSQLYILAKCICKIALSEADVVRLGVLSNGTVDLLLPMLTVTTLRHGIWSRIIGTTFNQVAPQALNPTSEINLAECHYVLLAIDHRGLPLNPTPGDLDRAYDSIDGIAVHRLTPLRTARFVWLHGHCNNATTGYPGSIRQPRSQRAWLITMANRPL